MSYELHSEKGFVCNLGSASRYNELIKDVDFCNANGKLCAFLKTGKTDEPREVIDEIDQVLKGIPEIKVTWIMLKELKLGLKKANKFAKIVR